MDLATIIGLTLAWVNVIYSIAMGSNPLVFLDIPSILIVFGGTTGIVMARFNFSDLALFMKAIRYAFKTPKRNLTNIIQQFVKLSNISRREGLLALERQQIDDPFMKKGIDYCVDGTEAEKIQDILQKEIDYLGQRHETATKILDAISVSAPAMGMIGTLIGLVQMLSGMDDPKAIGPGMAVAIITTLYGALIANLATGPLKDKLDKLTGEEVLVMEIIKAGVMGIHSGENSRILSETLKAHLSPKERQLVEAASDAKA